MTFPFPPPSPESIVRHYMLLGWLALLAVVFVWRLFRPVQGWEPLVWWPGVPIVTLILLDPNSITDATAFRPALSMYAFAACLALALVAFAVNAVRLFRQERRRWARASLVIGIGITTVMCLLLLTGGSGTREAARKTMCSYNMRDIGLAMHDWHEEYGRFPDMDCSDEGNPPLSWRVASLQFLDGEDLREEYDDTKPWDDSANIDVALRKSPRLQCPSHVTATDDDGRWFTAYVLVTGPDTIAPEGKGLSFPEITDGSSKTLLTVEAAGMNVVWTEPRDFDLASQPVGVNLPGDAPGRSPGMLSSYHEGGAIAAFADGSVQFLLEDIDPRILEALATATGGEQVERP